MVVEIDSQPFFFSISTSFNIIKFHVRSPSGSYVIADSSIVIQSGALRSGSDFKAPLIKDGSPSDFIE